jgi:hypothetical protein
MLATTAPAVKLQTYSTPEQASCAKAVDRSLPTFWALVERLRRAADQQQPIHQVEEAVFRDLLAMGLDLLRAFLALSGDGDAGPNLTVCGDGPDDPPRGLPRLDQPRRRPYLSIFGEVQIERVGYGHDRLEAAPLDARLHLPRRQYSYLFQQWLGLFVVDDSHAESIKKLETILGLGVSVRASEDLNREQGSDVEPFQNHLSAPEATQEGPILVVTADCKGVPLVRKALPPEEETTDTPLPALANQRRGKGEKANQKKMAAVGAVYTIEPFVRTADEVIDEVLRKKAAQRRPKPAHKRVRAELLVHDRQGEYLPEGAICILDLFHVLERLWKVAWCFFDEASQKPEAQEWVEKELRMLLEGKVRYVVGGLRQMMTKRELKGTSRKTVREATGYFERNRARMKYDEYLAAGYPIGSGVVEGACRHLVKDRLERTGMRWHPEGAQAMLNLRATYLNGEWDSFWAYHVEQEDERLYGKLRETG